MKISFTGDSITGYADSSKWIKFSQIVECMVAARWPYASVTVNNRGIGGNTTTDLLARLQADVLDESPDLVVLLIGGNDAGVGCPKATTAANLETLVTKIKSVCPRVLMLQYHLVAWPDCPEMAWTHLVSNNDLIADVAQRHDCALLDMKPRMEAAVDKSIPVVTDDFREWSAWQGKSGYRVCDLVDPDGVHLRSGGEIVYARCIFERLLALGWLESLDAPVA